RPGRECTPGHRAPDASRPQTGPCHGSAGTRCQRRTCPARSARRNAKAWKISSRVHAGWLTCAKAGFLGGFQASEVAEHNEHIDYLQDNADQDDVVKMVVKLE